MLFVPEKRSCGEEYLDLDPERYRPEELEGTLADIRIINRYLGDQHAVLKHLARLAGDCSSFTLLDVATGSADIPVAIVDWARRRGMTARVTGVDLNEQTVAIARKHTASYPEIDLQVADGLRLPFRDNSFDFVICCKSAHHLSDDEIATLFHEMLRVARRGYFLMDLRRSWIAYGLIRLLTRIFTRNRLTRYDGPLSVLKSFTDAELASLAAKGGARGFSVTREPFWLLVLSGELS